MVNEIRILLLKIKQPLTFIYRKAQNQQVQGKYFSVNINYVKTFSLRATDADVGANAAIRYAIIGGNTQMQFSIDSLSGDVSLVKPLDYEQVRSYRLVIRAQGLFDNSYNMLLLVLNKVLRYRITGTPFFSYSISVAISVSNTILL